MTRSLAVVLIVLSFSLGACGFSNPESTPVPPSPIPTVPAGATFVTAEMKDFLHQDLEIKVNTVVEWVNNDATLHSTSHIPSESGVSGLWNSGRLAPGATFTHHFQKPGVYHYVCLIHPVNMNSKITVTE